MFDRYSLRWILLIALLCGQPADASANELKLGVSSLFQLGEKNTPTQLAAARRQYEALERDFSTSAGLDYSYALVLINQHRYADALPLVERYLARYPNDEDAIRVKLWVRLQTRRYGSALDDAVDLSRRIAEHQAATVERQTIPAQFLGTVLGYLELVRPEAVDESVRKNAKSEILEALSAQYLDAFDQGRQSVADRLTALKDDQLAKQQRTAQRLAVRREALSTAQEDDRQTIAFNQDKMESSTAELHDTQRKLKVLRHQLATLAQDRAQVTAQIIAVQTQLTQLSAEWTNDETQRDAARRFGVIPESMDLTEYAQFVTLSTTLFSLNRQALRLDQRIAAMQSEANQLGATFNRAAQATAESQAAIKKAGRRAKVLQGQARRLDKQKPKSRGLTAEMKRLSTYLPFPFEEEKRRVLGWFTK